MSRPASCAASTNVCWRPRPRKVPDQRIPRAVGKLSLPCLIFAAAFAASAPFGGFPRKLGSATPVGGGFGLRQIPHDPQEGS